MSKNYRIHFAVGVLLLVAVAGYAILVYELPYAVEDVGLMLSLLPVLIALSNINTSAGFRKLLVDPVNAGLLIAFTALMITLLLRADTGYSVAVIAGLLLVPAYGLLVRIAWVTGQRRLGFGFFNSSLLLLFLPVILNDSAWTRWNPLAPSWLFVATDFSWTLLPVLLTYAGVVIWMLPKGMSD
jgi:hypothetical protein